MVPIASQTPHRPKADRLQGHPCQPLTLFGPKGGSFRWGAMVSIPLRVAVAALLSASATATAAPATVPLTSGLASWYGEEHRGKLMANGKSFDPDKLTAASWFYPLGTKVRVSIQTSAGPARTVVVTITDRGPNRQFVSKGRTIDLARAAFERIAPPSLGLVAVSVQRVP